MVVIQVLRDEEKEDGDGFEGSAAEKPKSTPPPPPPPPVDDFMNTDDFKRLLVRFAPGYYWMKLRLLSEAWFFVVKHAIESGPSIEHDGQDLTYPCDSEEIEFDPMEQYGDFQEGLAVDRKLVTRVDFLQNIPKVGAYACCHAVNLVIVEIPEGVVTINESAFESCISLTFVSFPPSLTSIGHMSFCDCYSLNNVDLRHTNLQELDEWAFRNCEDLSSVTIPDSLQTLGDNVFHDCSKLVPSNIDVTDYSNDTTSDVVAHLRSQQQQPTPL